MIERADYVVIGGGSAGCVLAARLSENPSVSVVLLEAGGKGQDFLVKMPAGTAKLMGHPSFDWCLPTEADPSIGGRTQQWSAGKALGGSSAINGQVYMRGNRSDYDAWAAAGCTGWSFEEIFPYFLKAETFHGPSSQSHGSHGPLSVSPIAASEQIGQHVIEAFNQIGLETNEDYCDGNQNGVYRIYATQKDGQRCSTARGYLEPVQDRPNLTVIVDALVEKVVISDRQVVAVQFHKGDQSFNIGVNKEAIVSAGTVHSPAMLMRSGIGPADQLKDHGIEVINNLPGVGQNLREHNGIALSKLVNIPTMGAQLGSFSMVKHLLNYLLFKKGLLTTPAVQVMAGLKTDPAFADPDVILSMLPVAASFNDRGDVVVEPRPSFSMGFHVGRPKSRGEIRLRSANFRHKPVIDHRLQGDADDVDRLVKACLIVEKACQAPALAKIITGTLKPDPYPENHTDWVDYIRAFGGIGYHPVGTCKMGPDGDPMAVLDPQLRVRGIEGLRVIDASVMPEPVAANTNAPTIMIAEKGAELIKCSQ